jgi:hypothetical protein
MKSHEVLHPRKAAATIVIVATLLVAGCASFSQFGFDSGPRTITLQERSWEIVGTVRREMVVHSVLGLPPVNGYSFALFTWGDATYDTLLQEAQRMGADDVINITVDFGTHAILTVLYNERTYIANGLAIRYAREKEVESAVPSSQTAQLAEEPTTAPLPVGGSDESGRATSPESAIPPSTVVSGFEIGANGGAWSGSYELTVDGVKTTETNDRQGKRIIRYVGPPSVWWNLTVSVSEGSVTIYEIIADDDQGRNYAIVGRGQIADSRNSVVHVIHAGQDQP